MEEAFNLKKFKLEKANKIQKHRQLRKIANLLRYVEMCVVLVLISRLSMQQLPLALKNSTEYFRGFTVSPRLVFLVGNIIIITLFAQSGHFSNHDSATRTGSEPDLYLEFLQNSTMYQKFQGAADQKRLSMKGHRIDGCMIKQDEKQGTKTGGRTKLALGEKKSTKASRGLEVKDYRRCQSEIVMVGGVNSSDEETALVLQRCESESESDKSRRGRGSASASASAPSETQSIVMMGKSSSFPEDGMSNDEFRRTVEAFIARQQRLRLQELQTVYS